MMTAHSAARLPSELMGVIFDFLGDTRTRTLLVEEYPAALTQSLRIHFKRCGFGLFSDGERRCVIEYASLSLPDEDHMGDLTDIEQIEIVIAQIKDNSATRRHLELLPSGYEWLHRLARDGKSVEKGAFDDLYLRFMVSDILLDSKRNDKGFETKNDGLSEELCLQIRKMQAHDKTLTGFLTKLKE